MLPEQSVRPLNNVPGERAIYPWASPASLGDAGRFETSPILPRTAAFLIIIHVNRSLLKRKQYKVHLKSIEAGLRYNALLRLKIEFSVYSQTSNIIDYFSFMS